MIFDLITKAKDLFFDNKNSSLSATNAQAAIDEITRKYATKEALGGKTTHIDLTGQLQTATYRRSVIALCKTSATNTVANSYTNGKVMFTINNGSIATMASVDVFIAGTYEGDNTIACRLDVSTNLSTALIKPCTFTYNGVTYGGLVVDITANKSSTVLFDGSTNFGIFALDYLDTKDNVILNEEIYNSFSYDNVIWLTNNKLNNEQIVRESDLAEVKNELLEVNGKGTWLNTSILAKALKVSNGIHNYGLAENSYTDTSDLPSDIYKNSFATIYRRASYDISVVLWGTLYNGVVYPTVINYYRTDKGWSGWKTFATTEDIDTLSTLIGDKSYISTLGDGTVTSAISAVNGKVSGISATLANKANGDSSGNAVNSNKWGNYQLRTGTSGASGYITFETE